MLSSIPIRSTTQHLAVFLLPGQESALPVGLEAAIYLQFQADPSAEWRPLGALRSDKASAIFKITLPVMMAASETLLISLGISLQPASSDLQVTRPAPVASSSSYALLVAKKLLDNFVNYALSFAQSFVEGGGESFVPGKIITEWYASTLRKAQADPEGFLKQLMKTSEVNE